MYYNHEKDVLESFPGFRKLIKLDAPIHGIYHLDVLAETYLVHAGDALYRCRFINQYKDTLSNLKLCNMANSKSFAYRNSGKIYIIDGEDITVVYADENVEKFSENPDIAYVPTT